jgi:hypothetical protein
MMDGLGAEAWVICHSQSNPPPHLILLIAVWPLRHETPGLQQLQPLTPRWFQCDDFDVL